jgi:hypothetical protein
VEQVYVHVSPILSSGSASLPVGPTICEQPTSEIRTFVKSVEPVFFSVYVKVTVEPIDTSDWSEVVTNDIAALRAYTVCPELTETSMFSKFVPGATGAELSAIADDSRLAPNTAAIPTAVPADTRTRLLTGNAERPEATCLPPTTPRRLACLPMTENVLN